MSAQPLFPIGDIILKQEAQLALMLSAQDADFFIRKHVLGEWEGEEQIKNLLAVAEGQMVWSKFRTLKGHELHVMTTSDRTQTFIFTPPNSVIPYKPLLTEKDFPHWLKKQEDR
jgi:hypothetical protein